jgi:hypothetical protein
VVLIDQMLHVNGMQDQLGTVDRSQARRKRWFAHYPQSIAISALVTVSVLVPEAISSQLPVPQKDAKKDAGVLLGDVLFGYRTNVCRRRLASDLARASDVVRPKGLTRITMTGCPVPHAIDLNLPSPKEFWIQLLTVFTTAVILFPGSITRIDPGLRDKSSSGGSVCVIS